MDMFSFPPVSLCHYICWSLAVWTPTNLYKTGQMHDAGGFIDRLRKN
jgi:hypothetical protein